MVSLMRTDIVQQQIERAAEKMLAPVAVPVHKARNTF